MLKYVLMNHSPRVVLHQPAAGQRQSLADEDALHLTKALRLEAGAELEVLDGQGAAWAARLVLERRGAGVEIGELLRTEAVPGSADANLPRIEIWAPLPKGPRAQDCVARLAQLGVAVWQPIITRHTEAEARADGEGRREKLERVARETLKQSGGLHALQLLPAVGLEQARWKGEQAFLLDPYAKTGLSTAIGLRLEGKPKQLANHTVQLIAGPEAGFAAEELEALKRAGAMPVRLSTHVLRIETALEAAAAITAERLMRG